MKTRANLTPEPFQNLLAGKGSRDDVVGDDDVDVVCEILALRWPRVDLRTGH